MAGPGEAADGGRRRVVPPHPKTYRSRIHEYVQRTNSTRNVAVLEIDGEWQVTVTITPHRVEPGTRRTLTDGAAVIASATCQTKKEAEEQSSRALLDVINLDSAPDTRPTVKWDSFLRPLWKQWRSDGLAVRVGQDHLADLRLFGDVVAVDTEGQPPKWVQLTDSRQAMVLPLNDQRCRRSLAEFMRETQSARTFVVWDAVAERRSLPELPNNTVDAQALYDEVHSRPGGPNYKKVSLARAVEHHHYKHDVKLLKPRDGFYRAFDKAEVKALTEEHLRYMMGDSLLTYYVYHRLLANGRRCCLTRFLRCLWGRS